MVLTMNRTGYSLQVKQNEMEWGEMMQNHNNHKGSTSPQRLNRVLMKFKLCLAVVSPFMALYLYLSCVCVDPAAAAVAWSFLGCLQHAAGGLSGHLCALSALAVGAETSHPPTAPAAAGRHRRHIRVKLYFSTILYDIFTEVSQFVIILFLYLCSNIAEMTIHLQ